MKKSQLKQIITEQVDAIIENGNNNYAPVVIPSDKVTDMYVVVEMAKRGIRGIYITLEDLKRETESSYDVKDQIVEVSDFKDDDYTDREAAIESIYETVIASLPKIKRLLTVNDVKSLRQGDNVKTFAKKDTAFII